MAVLFTDILSTADWKAFLRTEQKWQSEVNRMSAISFLEHCSRLVAFTSTFSSFSSAFCHQEEFITICKLSVIFSRHSHLLFAVPKPVRTPCISRYTISSKAMSSQLPALAVRLQCHSCDTVCAGTGTVGRHVQICCGVLSERYCPK